MATSAATLRLVAPDGLSAAEQAQWDALGQSSGTANVFAEPWFARLSLAHCDAGGNARLAIVQAPSGIWLGVLPLESRPRHGRAPLPNWRGWSHANQFLGTPLVRTGFEPEFWRALLAGLDRLDCRHMALALAAMPCDEAVTGALHAVCAEQGRALKLDAAYARAQVLAVPHAPEASGAAIGGKARRRIESLERKLERQHGALEMAVHREAEAVADLIDPFLALEQSGWKGRAGSALASQADTHDFFRSVAMAAAERGRFELATLSAGGRVVAMVSLLAGPDCSFGFKMAFDETAADCGPGQVLLYRLTQDLCRRNVGLIDSCSVPGQEPVSRLWPDRRELVDCCMALGGPLRRGMFSVMMAAERAWQWVKPGKSS